MHIIKAPVVWTLRSHFMSLIGAIAMLIRQITVLAVPGDFIIFRASIIIVITDILAVIEHRSGSSPAGELPLRISRSVKEYSGFLSCLPQE